MCKVYTFFGGGKMAAYGFKLRNKTEEADMPYLPSRVPDIRPVSGADVAGLIDDYLIDCQLDDLNPRTVDGYRYQFAIVLQWWAEYGPSHDHLITPQALKQFLVWMRVTYRTQYGKPLESSSRNTAARRLRQLFTWLYRTRRLPVDITEWVPLPSKAANPHTRVQVDMLAGVLKAATGGRMEKRDAALVAFLAATGARRMEAAAVRIMDVQIHADGSGVCWLPKVKKTKQSVPRHVLFGPGTGHLLAAWLDELQARPWDEKDPLFSLAHGEAVYKAIKRLGERAGHPEIKPHDLRRLFSSYWASNYPDNDRAMFFLSLLMGHQGKSITETHYILLESASEDIRPFYVSPVEEVVVR